jgi:hypothetical protein
MAIFSPALILSERFLRVGGESVLLGITTLVMQVQTAEAAKAKETNL